MGALFCNNYKRMRIDHYELSDIPVKKRRVAIQGYEGCFHQEAAHEFYGNNIEIVPCATFRELTSKVESLEADAGIMAIENSIAGSILPNYSLLQNCSLKITGEVYLSIVQNLLVIPGVKLKDIEEVRTHPMAILQCLDFLEKEGHGRYRLVESVDTARSAKEVSEQRLINVAAIAGNFAAEIYGLEILAPNINTVKNNFTRFLALERADKVMPNMNINKSSLYFEVAHQGGSLISVLRCFESCNLNMTKLQSYPIPSDPFHYLFHADVEFDKVSDFENAITHARGVCTDMSICGVYTKADKIL